MSEETKLPMAPSHCPLVSVGIAVYNEERFLHETLESLSKLDYPNLEFIISDNASTDGTVTICEDFAARDSRFSLFVSKENRGATRNFEFVRGKARGEFVMFASGHDLWHPDFVRECLIPLQQNPHAGLSYVQAQRVDSEGRLLGLHGSPFDARESHRIYRGLKTLSQASFHLGVPLYGLFRRSVVSRLSPFRPCFGPDFVFLFEVSLASKILQVERRDLFLMRVVRDEDAHAFFEGYCERLCIPGNWGVRRLFCHTVWCYYLATRRQFRLNPLKRLIVMWLIWPLIPGKVRQLKKWQSGSTKNA